jgi:hypothetical protein
VRRGDAESVVNGIAGHPAWLYRSRAKPTYKYKAVQSKIVGSCPGPQHDVRVCRDVGPHPDVLRHGKVEVGNK